MAGSETHYIMDTPSFSDPVKLLIVVSPYYKDIADNLVAGAKAEAEAAGAEVEVIEVPGALEIPGAIAMAEESERYEGYVALGCVIRGETSHYDIVAGESARGLMALSMEGVAVGNAILTCENGEQAMARASVDGKNKGAEAVKAALMMIDIREKMAPRR